MANDKAIEVNCRVYVGRSMVVLALMFFVSVLCFASQVSTVAATSGNSGGGGGGNNSSSSDDPCKYGDVSSQKECNDGSHLGGSSWHIFKTGSGVRANGLYYNPTGPKYCLGNDYSKNCTSDGVPSTLNSGGYNWNLASTCPSTVYSYYVAFVRDGWNGRTSDGKKNNKPTYWGPISYTSTDYNNYDNKNLATLQAGYGSGTNMHGWRITLGAAKAFCKDATSGPCKNYNNTDNSLPSVGFICVLDSTLNPTRTLTAKSVDVNGKSLSKVTNLADKTTTASKGATVSLVRSLTNAGYTYRGYESTLDGSYKNNTKETFTTVLNDDTLFYFVYEAVNVSSSLTMKVKNKNVSTYGDYADEVYAKPSDVLSFNLKYSSGAQDAAGLYPQKINVNKTGDKPATVNTASTLSGLFGAYSGLGNWTNSVNVSAMGFVNPFDSSYNLTVGKVESSDVEKEYTVRDDNVGYIKDANNKISPLKQVARTADGTPSRVSIGLNASSYSVANVSTGLESAAMVKVPYNFTITPSITSPGIGEDNSKILYAGESTGLEGKIVVGSKENTVTEGDYATRADDIQTKLVVYDPAVVDDSVKKDGGTMVGDRNANICSGFYSASNGCSHSGDGQIDSLNPGESDVKNLPSFIVEDVPAGSRRCVALAVFPATSGADNNWSDRDYKDANGNSYWRVSSSKCYVVAKRPSLQVWGGNIYSNADINTALSHKKHLANSLNYDAGMTEAGSHIFGSWGELGLIAVGEVKGFASGASLGYAQNNDGPGGYHNSSSDDEGVLCVMSPLTIANENCNTGTVGNLGTDTAIGGISKDRDSVRNLAEALGIGGTNAVFGVLSTFQEENYYEAAGDLTIGQSEDLTVPEGRTILIHGKGNILISKNIIYKNDGYQNLLQTPKLIIYSDKTINIDCTVTRIDAVLLADTVDTCPTQDNNWNPRQNSNQLFIYGAVIANNLKANRTYGAAPGNNSIVPAEIIDFDPTLYLWKGINEGADDSGSQESNGDKNGLNANVVYLRELAPRY